MEDTPTMDQKPIALDAYEALAEAYAMHVDANPHNVFYERPTTFSLLPDLQGKRVLDAGCGPGANALIFHRLGARVVAVDVSEKMVRLARARLNEDVAIFQADLDEPFTFCEPGSFDIVVCSLVLDYLRDLEKVFRSFYAVLKRPGALIFSCSHPFFDFANYRISNYFESERVGCEWRSFGNPVFVPWFRRPLNAIINPMLAAGFCLDHLLEPKPSIADKNDPPNLPGFMCVRALK